MKRRIIIQANVLANIIHLPGPIGISAKDLVTDSSTDRAIAIAEETSNRSNSHQRQAF
jgi:hypothetical protein